MMVLWQQHFIFMMGPLFLLCPCVRIIANGTPLQRPVPFSSFLLLLSESRSHNVSSSGGPIKNGCKFTQPQVRMIFLGFHSSGERVLKRSRMMAPDSDEDKRKVWRKADEMCEWRRPESK